MIRRKIREINMSINSKKIGFKTNYINSISKSNISTSNYSNINPDKNKKTIESYEDFQNKCNPNINGISTKDFMLNSPQNKINFNNNITENRSEDIKQLPNPTKNFIYIRKKQKKYNNNNRFNIIKNKNCILLNDYRKRIMKLFLSCFRPYYFIFLRKHFLSFIRNITYLIMKKELFYKNISKLKTKKLKINKLGNIQLSRSYENLQLSTKNNYAEYRSSPRDKNTKCIRLLNTLTNKNNEKQNLRYDFFNLNNQKDNFGNSPKVHCSPIYSNSINTMGRIYEFRNIFISSNNPRNKSINTNRSMENRSPNRCFIKKIKDIVTQDKRIYIRINYIYLIPKNKRKLKNISQTQLNDINNSLTITQIYSYEYLSDELSKIEKVNNIVEILNFIFITKEKKIFLYILKVIKLVKCLDKILKIISLNKLGIPKKETKSYSNDIFLFDDKMVINVDNFNNLDYNKDV